MTERSGLNAPNLDRFTPKSLLMSRTDTRGVIQSFNSDFVTVSAHEVDALLGAPHKVIRHPDMPSGVFHAMWDSLNQGRPFGGYVCNLAKDGRAYWVFAVVTPVEDGFISVRLRPSTDLLPEISELYDRMRTRERDEGLSPADSAAAIEEAVREMKFDGYRHFMAHALYRETEARAAILGHGPMERVKRVEMIADKVGQIEAFGAEVASLFARTEQIPYNMRLQAGRLEGSDGPISVISENHRQMSQSLNSSVGDFRSAAALGTGPIQEAVFVMATSCLMDEAIVARRDDAMEDDGHQADDVKRLQKLKTYYDDQAKSVLTDVTKSVRQFSQQCKDMRRMLSGLEMTRIMCKIERAKTDGDTEGLDEIVNRLQVSEQNLGAVMTKLDNAIDDILDSSDKLIGQNLAVRLEGRISA